MNIFQAFLRESTTDFYDTRWRELTLFFPNIIEQDKHLNKLLEDQVFLKEKWIDIRDEIKHEIEDELLWLPYIRTDLLDETSLVSEIIRITHNILKANLLKTFSDDNIDSSTLPQQYTFLEDNQTIQFRTSSLESTTENNDLDILNELRQLENKLKNFRLDDKEILSRIYKEITPHISRPIIQKVPIVKHVEYFDPYVYNLIQANPELLKTLDWRMFEEMLADILKTFGYTIELTRKTKDGGIDVIAIKSDRDFGQHKYILQAKRYAHSVQVSPVRELLYLHNEQRASKSCLATTTLFTKGAWELAEKNRWTLELKDRGGILEWIDRVIEIKRS